MTPVNTTLLRASRACDYVHNTARLKIVNQLEGINMTLNQFRSLDERMIKTRNQIDDIFSWDNRYRKSKNKPP